MKRWEERASCEPAAGARGPCGALAPTRHINNTCWARAGTAIIKYFSTLKLNYTLNVNEMGQFVLFE